MPSEETLSRIREAFRVRRGFWNEDWEALLHFNAPYVEAYLELSAYTAERGSLSPKMRELIYVATNCSPSHFFERGVRQHGRFARNFGASIQELIGVAMIVSTVSVQTYLLGASVLEELAPGILSMGEPDAHARAVRKLHLQLFGAALPEVDAGIKVDPTFYDVWLRFAATAFGAEGPLSPKDSHLIALAAYAQCTQLSGPGVRQHMRAALANGASSGEILDVCKLITSMGVHAVALGVPVLLDEWEKSP